MEIENNTFSRLIRFSSADGIRATDTASNFNINLNRMTETDSIIRMVVKAVSFPNTQYNVFDFGPLQNNTFVYLGNLVPRSFQIPAGFYNLSELMSVVQTSLQVQLDAFYPGNTITIAQNPTTKKVEFTLTPLPAADQFILTGSPAVNNINKLLGNVQNILINGAVGQVAQVTNLPTLYGLTKAYVHSLEMGEQNLVDSDVESHDVIAECPVDVPFGSMVHYESRDDELDSVNYRSTRNYDGLNIQLKDINENFLELNGGGDVVLIVKVYYL